MYCISIIKLVVKHSIVYIKEMTCMFLSSNRLQGYRSLPIIKYLLITCRSLPKYLKMLIIYFFFLNSSYPSVFLFLRSSPCWELLTVYSTVYTLGKRLSSKMIWPMLLNSCLTLVLLWRTLLHYVVAKVILFYPMVLKYTYNNKKTLKCRTLYKNCSLILRVFFLLNCQRRCRLELIKMLNIEYNYLLMPKYLRNVYIKYHLPNKN